MILCYNSLLKSLCYQTEESNLILHTNSLSFQFHSLELFLCNSILCIKRPLSSLELSVDDKEMIGQYEDLTDKEIDRVGKLWSSMFTPIDSKTPERIPQLNLNLKLSEWFGIGRKDSKDRGLYRDREEASGVC